MTYMPQRDQVEKMRNLYQNDNKDFLNSAFDVFSWDVSLEYIAKLVTVRLTEITRL